MPPDKKKSTCKTEAVLLTQYGLPKIHRAGVPLRPIVSTIASPTYHIAKHMSKLLEAHTGKTESVDESLNYFSEIFPKNLVDIFRACLSTSYFVWDGNFYEQIDGVAMGYCPVIVNFFMERFEQLMLESVRLKPKVWLRYIDDTFVVWNHGEEELQLFLQHINSKNKNIQFTMEKEENDLLSFLDVLATKSTENRHILTDICTKNPITIPAKKRNYKNSRR